MRGGLGIRNLAAHLGHETHGVEHIFESVSRMNGKELHALGLRVKAKDGFIRYYALRTTAHVQVSPRAAAAEEAGAGDKRDRFL